MFKVGADPEAFVKKDGKIVEMGPHLYIPKHRPRKRDEHVGVITDNVAVEWTIRPADGVADLKSSMEDSLGYVGELLGGVGLEMEKEKDAVTFEKVTHSASRRFGCSPDFNAWTGEINPRPRMTDLRSVGGHIHIDLTKCGEYVTDILEFVRKLDFFLGLPMYIKEGESPRRKLYGRFGDYRVKPYGVEYRTPSNKWVFNQEWYADIFEGIERALKDKLPERILTPNLTLMETKAILAEVRK